MQLDVSNDDLKGQIRERCKSQLHSPDRNMNKNEDIVNQQQEQSDNQYMTLIQATRKKIKSMAKAKRFQKARQHLMDALNYKSPRPQIKQVDSSVFWFIYTVQTSIIRDYLLFFFSYAFMYFIIIDSHQNFIVKVVLESIVLFIMWIDIAFEIYHKSYETLRTQSKFSFRFYLRVAVLCLLVIDQILYAVLQNQQRIIRPFRILRATLPLFYDQFARKTMEALLASWKDILAYLMFYTIVIFSFALIANQLVQMPEGIQYDQYRQDYGNYLKSIYLIYVVSSYDSYPDNQLIAIRQNTANYAIFIIFIILNLFFFTVIPATLIFGSFRDTRSKILLIDQIKQQHSLLLCFISLGQQDNLNIKMEKMVEFLLFVYKNKVRYIDYVTYVCLKLDDNNNHTIHVNEFMQICKILQSNTKMMPPTFGDFQPWIRFKIWINEIFPLFQIASGKAFKITEIIVIILCFSNCVLILVLVNTQVVHILDYIFIGLYVLLTVIKIFGLGPEKYFETTLDKVDFLLVLIALILQIVPNELIAHNSDVLIKMVRIYKVMQLVEIFQCEDNGIYRRFSQLFGQTAIILPIILKFSPMILIVYYILGVIGMQAFYTTDAIDINRSQYSGYQQFTNFKQFLGTQFFMIQVLTQAGWSMVAFNEADRFGFYGLVMLYFISCHVTTVLILASLLKGLIWETYNCVNEQYKNRRIAESQFDQKQKARQRKKQQIEQIKKQLDISDNLLKMPDTILKKQLYENRIDAEILIKLKGIYNSDHPNKKLNRQAVSAHTVQNKKILISQIMLDVPESLKVIVSKDKQESDNNLKHPDQFEEQMQNIIGSMIIRPNTLFSQVVLYPKLFIEFLQKRLIDPIKISTRSNLRNLSSFDLDQNYINNKKSLNLLTSELNSILDIEKSQKQQKADIIRLMVDKQIFDQQQAKRVFFKNSGFQSLVNQPIDINWVIRDTFLGPTNPKLISKFQTQYFSDVYGKQFREINQITLEPLLRYEATLTYCLRNLLRYPNIDQMQFFTILSTIEDKLSNRILKKGSLFKFVYQIDTLSDSWFSIQLKQNKDIKIHFIKSGIWIYHSNMKPSTIHFGDDIFNWDGIKGTKDFKICSGYMKRLYQAFQSLAFCLLDQNKFFSGNPNSYIYDLYCLYKDVRKNQRKQNKKQQLRISKIMVVILSKQQERQRKRKLPYELSQLKREQTVEKKNLSKFKFDQTQDKTFQKLKQLAVMDHQRIIQSQGLPYAFILNLLKQIQQVLELHNNNLVEQIQNVLNKEVEEAQEHKKSEVQIDL